MKPNELNQMSIKELRALRARVDGAIASRHHRERENVKAKLTDLAADAGFSVDELFGKRASVRVKYRNPDDPSQTWTGRGKRPRWLVKAGGDIERFRV